MTSTALIGVVCAAVLAGCTQTRRVHVPSRCIQRVTWSRPCEAVSESLIKCDGVMVAVSCVSAGKEVEGKIERGKFGE